MKMIQIWFEKNDNLRIRIALTKSWQFQGIKHVPAPKGRDSEEFGRRTEYCKTGNFRVQDIFADFARG